MLSLLFILIYFQMIKLNYKREQKIINENNRIQYFGVSFNTFALHNVKCGHKKGRTQKLKPMNQNYKSSYEP